MSDRSDTMYWIEGAKACDALDEGKSKGVCGNVED